MNLLIKVRENILEKCIIQKDSTIVVGCSGGPDSMFLLLSLFFLQRELSFRVIVAHVNHGVRGEEAFRDEMFVKNYCEFLKIPCHITHVDMNAEAKITGVSAEEAGRKLRYDYFRSLIPGNGRVAVAHTMDDQAETVLMRLIRGTGSDGLAAMSFQKDDIIRPLLNIKRRDIISCLHETKIPYVLDQTNFETDYTRNYVRKEILPKMKEINPKVKESLFRLSQITSEEISYLEEEVTKIVNLSEIKKDGIYIDKKVLEDLPKALQSRVLRSLFEKASGNLKDLSEAHIASMRNSLSLPSGKGIDLPNQVYMEIVFHRIRFSKKGEGETTIKPTKLDFGRNQTPFGIIALQLVEKRRVLNDPNIAYLDFEKIEKEIFVRSRLSGDSFTPTGMKGSKKVKDIFMELKIPKGQRNRVPIVYSGFEIIWIPGYRVAEHVKINQKTKKILEIIFEEEKMQISNDVESVLIDEEEIKQKVKELGTLITEEYKNTNDLLVICILKGGATFMVDLIRQIPLDLTIDFMAVSSYGSGTTSTGEVRILKDLDTSVEGKEILIVEDIIDTGNTLNYLQQVLRSRGANSIEIVTLLSKAARRTKAIDVKYVGFEVEDLFVVGYGLDFDEKYRNLPYIGVLRKEIYS